MIRRPPRSTRVRSSAALDVYKRQHGYRTHLLTGGGVHREDLAAECREYLLLGVEHDVEGEIDARAGSDRPRVVVQGQHGVQAGQARGNQLRAAGEAGEEMRLDESCGDPHVRLDPVPIQPDRDAVAEFPTPGEHRRVTGIVIDDPYRC